MKRDVPHFRIGLLLTEAGIIAPKQLDEAIRQGDQDGTPFLRVLVGSGELKQHELQAVIRAQSLIWSGMLDVERAIKALTIVHSTDVSIDEGLRSVGWMRAESSLGETLASTVQTANPERTTGNEFPQHGPVSCQYCGTTVDAGSKLCTFCTGEAQRTTARVQIEPAWQKQAVPGEGARIIASVPARDPLLMGFLSCFCLAGLGQIVIGQAAKGFSVLFLALVLIFGTGGMACLFVFPLAGLDAYLLADKLRNGKTVGQWEFF
jgi:hypothetical protein